MHTISSNVTLCTYMHVRFYNLTAHLLRCIMLMNIFTCILLVVDD